MTISEVFDVDAGVRISAKQCFMIETISIHVKPQEHVAGPEYEASLKDEYWKQLLNKGNICGDERFVIGENSDREIVVLHFDNLSRHDEQHVLT